MKLQEFHEIKNVEFEEINTTWNRVANVLIYGTIIIIVLIIKAKAIILLRKPL